ncbi:MAG: hypothetical protein LLG37_11135 [Spirochaetia bacterium]|nr:hypothetical protein [Spirochaetia bacterium]
MLDDGANFTAGMRYIMIWNGFEAGDSYNREQSEKTIQLSWTRNII